ncbi:L,D-transpeptidase family protein [Actinomadura rayongensis]|uniref:L,D-transpeptidase family protein n=1 Tax=Actinomadura rayongensis TaxID=1429076 RepID=A0A6I4W970_9ACTN|nr:L,D-transpeptidase family protein [Actinomadura rayongensis]MXQ63282.1 L,D-transpeptidase family protein [Actinomadura rayongensis]
MFARTALLAAGLLVLAPAAPAVAAAPPPAALHLGSDGPDVTRLQRRLKALHYWPGEINGRFRATTRAAVWAFQHVNGLKATGVVDARTQRALRHPHGPHRLVRRSRPTRVDIDLRHRVLVVYKARRVVLISHLSSGSGRHFCQAGRCGVARTPTGNFRVERRINGWHKSYLGWMYRPLYFHGGFAMHGSLDVPDRDVSHGCVRLPMDVGDRIYGLVRNGTAVYVRR